MTMIVQGYFYCAAFVMVVMYLGFPWKEKNWSTNKVAIWSFVIGLFWILLPLLWITDRRKA